MIPESFSPTIHRFETVSSTNEVAKEFAKKGVSEGTLVVANSQTQGKGRGNRSWHSPKGGLYVSALLYPLESKRVTDLAILGGVAATQTVKEFLPKCKDVTVKWPNDCLVDWKKVGGVLCEAPGEEFFHFCVVGTGLNVNLTQEELSSFRENPFSATSFVIEAGGGSFDVEKVFQMWQAKLFNLYRLYQKEGFGQIKYLWERNCAFMGKKIELRDVGWREERGKKAEIGTATGTFLGIDETGGIVLSNAKGERRHYFTGEITCCWP